ncbi:MAG: hypothetical protein ACRDZ4_15230 [Egibacteraceae bacterium]
MWRQLVVQDFLRYELSVMSSPRGTGRIGAAQDGALEVAARLVGCR